MLLSKNHLKQFKFSVAFHTETSRLFCSARQMTGFYMKHKNRLKCVDPYG